MGLMCKRLGCGGLLVALSCVVPPLLAQEPLPWYLEPAPTPATASLPGDPFLGGLRSGADTSPALAEEVPVSPAALPPATQERVRASSVPETPQQTLEAIREGLIDEALQAPITVRSSAWIDQEGVLHENLRIRSDTQLRGIRMNQYLPPLPVPAPPEEIVESEPEPELPPPPPFVRTLQPSATLCQGPLDLRITANLEVHLEAAAQRGRYPYLQAVAEGFQETLLATFNADPAWHVVLQQPRGAANAYFAAVEGTGQELRPYHLQLVVREVREAREWGFATERADAGLRLGEPSLRNTSILPGTWRSEHRQLAGEVTLRFFAAGETQPQWQTSLWVEWHERHPGSRGLQLTATERSAIQQHLTGWLTELSQARACVPARFQVLEAVQNHLIINGGLEAGLRLGDRLIVADPSRIPRHILEAGVAEGMVLGEVIELEAYRARIRPLTGAFPPMRGTFPGQVTVHDPRRHFGSTLIALPL